MKRRLVVTIELEVEADGRSTDMSAAWATAKAACVGFDARTALRPCSAKIIDVKPAPTPAAVPA
jgi:hypothetical protein